MMSRSGKECMRIRKQISILKKYTEAAWLSARFYFMLRKMNRLRSENTQGILWRILCSLMSVQGIFTCIKGYVEMMEENVGGIKMMMEGTGTVMTAEMMKQYGGVLTGTEKKVKKL